MPLKSERVTLRLDTDTRKFIESFGVDGDNFSGAFQKMIELFNGQKTKKLLDKINILNNRISDLQKREHLLYENLSKMNQAATDLSVIQGRINNIHYLFTE